MGKLHLNSNNNSNHKLIFPLKSLQIGDLQSYLSDLSVFLARGSGRLYILVDNRPWLRDIGSHPAHLWQLMVTKSRLSPFANKARRRRREGKEACSKSDLSKSKKFERWFSLINAANLSRKRGLLPVKKLRNSLLLSSELRRTLYGFIVFEVAWTDVRGINYLNELQTDTSLVIETKIMRRWEFDSIEHAASSISFWFSGTSSEQLHLKEYLECAIGETFYDTEENFSSTFCIDDDDNDCNDGLGVDISIGCSNGSSSVYPKTVDDRASNPLTPPPTGPYKRRKVIKSFSTGVENIYSEETGADVEDSLDDTETCNNDRENTVEAKQYKDVLILFRFDDHDLPFKLRDVIMSDLRLLTLLEAGLPSWVIFLQSYPGFCHLYRPWMCPLARVLYVLISIITVLIGFYDLYKNVPVLKATASRLCGPLFDWIETWEMVSRIKYLGTMLFLHNFQKAIAWFLTVTRTTRSFFSAFTQPLAEPLTEMLGFLLPLWNVLIEMVENMCSMTWVLIESIFNIVLDLVQVVLWPLWLIVSIICSIATSVLSTMFWIFWEIFYAPIRMVLAMASLVASTFAAISELIGDILRFLSTIFQLASSSEATVSSYDVSLWRSLWSDIFSQVFRALKSILNGFVAFFTACNRHRLSIYNHMLKFIRRISGRAQRSQPSGFGHNRSSHGSQSPAGLSRKIHIS